MKWFVSCIVGVTVFLIVNYFSGQLFSALLQSAISDTGRLILSNILAVICAVVAAIFAAQKINTTHD